LDASVEQLLDLVAAASDLPLLASLAQIEPWDHPFAFCRLHRIVKDDQIAESICGSAEEHGT
jgi:hypothetical protein